MTDARMDERQSGSALLAFSDAMVKLHARRSGRSLH
jgi:hypothetical protein